MAAVLLLAVGCLIMLHGLVREREPACAGEPLSHWLYSPVVWSMDARSNLDTNAIPFLARALEKRDSLIGKMYQSLFPKLPSYVKSHLPRPRYASTYRANALKLLELLGRETPSAAPVIIPALVQALQTNDDPNVRFLALEELTRLARNDVQVARIMCKALTDEREPHVRAYVAYQLRFFERQQLVIVPALTNGLSDKDARVRVRAAESLLAFKASAQAAVPFLLQALKDKSPEVRQAASQVLKELQSDAAPSLSKEGDKR